MIPRFLERKLRRSACALSSRDGPQSGPGSYRSVSSLARQEAPGYSANPAFRACGSAAKVTANPPPVRARTGHAAGRALKAPGQCPGGKLACAGSVAGLAKPASCLRQGRGVAPQACRLLACGKAGKGTAKPPARTCTILSIKRGPQPPLRGAKRQRRHSAANRSAGAPAAKRQRRHSAVNRSAGAPAKKKDPLRGPFLRVDYSTRFRPWSRMTRCQ